MWIFTPTGFVSVVFKDGALQVRARDEESLISLAIFTGNEIIKTPHADYPYRLITDNQTFAKWTSDQIANLNYSNFKSEIAATRGYNFAKPLNKVWSVMHDVEDLDARSK